MLSRKAQRGRRGARLAARALSLRERAGILLALAALVGVAAGCGDGDGDDSGGGGGYGTPREAGPGTTELTVTVHPEGRGGAAPQTSEVSCGAAGPSDPDACDAIAALPDDAADPVPPGTACTEIYGGPDLVELTGTLDGTEVDTELTRENGCEIHRFEQFAPMLEVLFPDYEPGGALIP